MNSQSTMARTPVLNLNVSLLAARKPVGRNTWPSHPSNADRPMTSKLAMRSLLSALSISLPCLRRTLSSLCWYHSSYSCRISATESDPGLSCLFASMRSGTPRICGAERTVSRVRPSCVFQSLIALEGGNGRREGRERERERESVPKTSQPSLSRSWSTASTT